MEKSISFTPEGAVSVSYHDLIFAPGSLTTSIGRFDISPNNYCLKCFLNLEKAFGSHPSSLGIIIVRDLPTVFTEYREKMFRLCFAFATMHADIREKYVDPASKYSFGWSHGKETMNGRPDTMKGSYYANPIVDEPNVSISEREAFPEYYGKNIWPHEPAVEGFEEAFKNLGRFIFNVGCELATVCQPFVSTHLSDSSVSLRELISTSQTTKARLLHYFPPPAGQPLRADEPVDNWCGFHLDHSMLTGLCSAMYFRMDGNSLPTVVPPPSSTSGLYIRTRGGDLKKVAIPSDCLAFQTGEALESATGGKLRATPHCVRIGTSESAEQISRETFALFMQPNTDQPISSSENFGQFSKRIFSEHYAEIM